MKKKTEKRRQAILDVALQAFRELGFENTTMSEISSRLGGSKATLYNYFSSKEELFFETVFQTLEGEFEMVHNSFGDSSGDIAESLSNFGNNFLAFLYSPSTLASRKLTIAQAEKTELGKVVYEKGILRSEQLIADFLIAAMEQGKLKKSDPRIATKHLVALLESEILMPFLLNVKTEIDGDEIKSVTKRAIDVFVKAYEVSKAKS